MTNQTPESVIAEAMVNAGAPLMHSRVEEGVASALRAANMLREPGVPDVATEESEKRAWAIASHLERDRELIKAERDAALAALERVRARLGDILPDWSDSGVIAVADILAALDGAPEPEVKPSSTVGEAALIREAKAEAYEQGRIDQKRSAELYARYQRGELAEVEFERLMDTTNRRAAEYRKAVGS